MDKQKYFTRLSRILRWRLPGKEAEEILSDYEALLADFPTEDGAELTRKLGTPAQAARARGTPEAYGYWLAALAAMAVCLVVPALLVMLPQFYGRPQGLVKILFVVGTALSLVWFRPGQATRHGFFLPWKLTTGLLTLSVGVLAAGAIFWGLTNGVWERFPTGYYGVIARLVLRAFGAIALLLGLAGLVEARMDDRRWRMLYILALTLVLMCALVLLPLTSANDLADAAAYARHMTDRAQGNGVLVGIGLVAAGVALY